jgi:hypothetical protein
MKTGAIEYCGDFAGKRVICRHATDARQEIDPARSSSELNDLLGLKEISFLEAGLLEPELIQKREELARIVSSRSDKNVQIPGVTWTPVKCETLRADDDVINGAGI